jgi:hypothetical protein
MLYEKLKTPRFVKTEPFHEFAEFIDSQTKVARENAQKYVLILFEFEFEFDLNLI